MIQGLMFASFFEEKDATYFMILASEWSDEKALLHHKQH
jgi:hypothetical protein